MTSEAIFPSNQASTSTLRGKYLKILTCGAFVPNKGSTIIATAISDHNALFRE